LHANAYAEKRLAALYYFIFERLAQAGDGFKSIAAIAEGADTRQHTPVGISHSIGIRDDVDLAMALSTAARLALAAECRLPEP
jgi:hypothetical protein